MAGVLYCSFCGKADYEVGLLIAGPASLICDGCVEACVEIIAEHRQEPSREDPRPEEGDSNAGR